MNAVDSDDDGDGLLDDVEIAWFNYDPFDPDTDGDGITDDAEDFDGDGVTNGDEIAGGTDPLDPRSY